MKRLIVFLLLISLASAQQSLSPSERTGVFILVDNNYPIINIISPITTTYPNSAQILVNYTIIEHSLDSVWYSLNDKENISISSHFYLSLNEGNYALKIYANDSFGRVNFSEVQFNVTTAPLPPPSGNQGSASGSSGGSSQPIPKENKTETNQTALNTIKEPKEIIVKEQPQFIEITNGEEVILTIENTSLSYPTSFNIKENKLIISIENQEYEISKEIKQISLNQNSIYISLEEIKENRAIIKLSLKDWQISKKTENIRFNINYLYLAIIVLIILIIIISYRFINEANKKTKWKKKK